MIIPTLTSHLWLYIINRDRDYFELERQRRLTFWISFGVSFWISFGIFAWIIGHYLYGVK